MVWSGNFCGEYWDGVCEYCEEVGEEEIVVLSWEGGFFE